MSLTSEEITAKNFKTFYEGIMPYLGSYDKGKLTFVGEVKAFFAETAPNGFLVCDGATYNKADYPELANLLLSLTDHSAYEVSGDDTKFKVPDLRGEFLRGSGTNSHTNQGSGAGVGVHQDGTTSIPIRMDNNRSFVGGAAGQSIYPSNYDSVIGTSNYRAYNVASSTTGNKEDCLITSRPTNTSVLYCIAYKDTMVDLDFLSYGGERFAKSDMYDTNERVIGKWIDGKPLYQKTVDFGALPNNTSKGVAHGISNIDTVVEAKGFAYDNNQGYGQPLPLVYSNDNAIYNTVLSINDTSIRIRCNQDRSMMSGYVTLIYTKTTDTADSFKYSTPTDYSTEEKIVGTWIDGKPIYQKTFTGTISPTTASIILSSSLNNTKNNLVNFTGYIINNVDNNYLSIGYGGVAIALSASNLYMTPGSYTVKGYCATVQYTKTTDA